MSTRTTSGPCAFTPDGVRVARQLVMLGKDRQDELVAALLAAVEGS